MQLPVAPTVQESTHPDGPEDSPTGARRPLFYLLRFLLNTVQRLVYNIFYVYLSFCHTVQ